MMGTSDAPTGAEPLFQPTEQAEPVQEDTTAETQGTSDVDPTSGSSAPAGKTASGPSDPTVASTDAAPTDSTSADTSAAPEETELGHPPNTSAESQATLAAAQSTQDAPQQVPEQRPQTFVQPVTPPSDSSKRAMANDPGPATQEDYDRANSDEAKNAATEAGRQPNLLVGQRVTITGSHPEAGRMAHIIAVEFKDAINALLGSSGSAEARFAEVADYVLRTRDGRTDLLTATPDQVKPLEYGQGWGRGQI